MRRGLLATKQIRNNQIANAKSKIPVVDVRSICQDKYGLEPRAKLPDGVGVLLSRFGTAADIGNGVDVAGPVAGDGAALGVNAGGGVSYGERLATVGYGVVAEGETIGIEGKTGVGGAGVVGVLQEFVKEMGIRLVPMLEVPKYGGVVGMQEGFGVLLFESGQFVKK